MRQIAAIIALSLMLSGCLYSTPYGLLTIGQLAEVEHTKSEAVYRPEDGDCRVHNVRALEGNGIFTIGINPTSQNLHVRAIKHDYQEQQCFDIDLTCSDCPFVLIAGVNVQNYKIKSIDYYSNNLLLKLIVLPRQIAYLESALKTLKAQQ